MKKSPDLMNGDKVAPCLMDREAEEEIDTPDSLQLTKKMIKPRDLMNGIKVVSWRKDGETEEEINTPDSIQLGEKIKKLPDQINGVLLQGRNIWILQIPYSLQKRLFRHLT